MLWNGSASPAGAFGDPPKAVPTEEQRCGVTHSLCPGSGRCPLCLQTRMRNVPAAPRPRVHSLLCPLHVLGHKVPTRAARAIPDWLWGRRIPQAHPRPPSRTISYTPVRVTEGKWAAERSWKMDTRGKGRDAHTTEPCGGTH